MKKFLLCFILLIAVVSSIVHDYNQYEKQQIQREKNDGGLPQEDRYPNVIF